MTVKTLPALGIFVAELLLARGQYLAFAAQFRQGAQRKTEILLVAPALGQGIGFELAPALHMSVED